MTALLLALTLFFQSAPAAAPLTSQQVLDAHFAGISAQGLLNMIAAHPAIAPATDADLLALTQAGVPASVVEAYRSRSAQSAPTPAARPEDARLDEIIQLVKSGLSEDLIIRQIASSGQVFHLSSSDLIFLKNNQVPESVIATLISTGTSAKAMAQPAAFGPLVRITGFLKKDAPGTLNMKEGRLIWLDDKKPQRNFSIEIASIKTVWLSCSPRPEGNFCYSIGIDLFKGGDYEFRDFSWETGGNTQILSLFNNLKKDRPQIIFHEKVK